ncbi:hypothetical protein IV203_002154 [Nitzschia inconspicua]|uniref:Alpha-galactosidase n=1 Tax=Nitzschia inconspicua TaxID=303405 RepID=A0A9K3LAU3_9STRA|nr:hypothetical protein IV203_002154 [Nitzschia inconspicua]
MPEGTRIAKKNWFLFGVASWCFFICSDECNVSSLVFADTTIDRDFVPGDWLLRSNAGYPSRVDEGICWEDGLCGLEMSNGLLTRRWTVSSPAFGTVDLLMTTTTKSNGKRRLRQESMLRTIEPEASFTLSSLSMGTVEYRVGDLFYNDTFKAYLNRTNIKDQLRKITSEHDTTTFRYESHDIGQPVAPFNWTPGTRHSLDYASWPPKGIALNVHFRTRSNRPISNTSVDDPQDVRNLKVTMHYELYDGIPVMAKWMTIQSVDGLGNNEAKSKSDIRLSYVTVERVASYPPYGASLLHGALLPPDIVNPPPWLIAMTDQAHGTKCAWYDDFDSSNDTSTSKETPHDMGASEPLLICNYTNHGPGIRLFRSKPEQHGGSHNLFQSFRTLLLATDTSVMERHTLMRHRMTQVLLPHVTENPIFFHAVFDESNFHSNDTTSFRRVIDQMADVGFEMLIYSFGSGFDMETRDASYLQRIRDQVCYAKSKGIEVGGYDLICLDRGHDGYGGNVGDDMARVDAATGTLTVDACFASTWYDRLSEYVVDFIKETGITMLEADGPFGGSSCASTNHSHHDGLEDSVYVQTQFQNKFFLRLREMGVYLNQPDSYFSQGGSRTGMGYDEEQYSLPRWKQLTISRMGLYDDLYRNLPTQGWMFVPLTEYHSGGTEATFAHHPEELEWAVAQYLGAGTAACYKNESTVEGSQIRSIFDRWISFYKSHRETIIQPVVHLRRPTMNGWDGWLHVHPLGKVEVGLAMIFNPTDQQLRDIDLTFPLYYTSLTDEVVIMVNEGKPVRKTIERDYTTTLVASLPPRSIHTFIFERPTLDNTRDDSAMRESVA